MDFSAFQTAVHENSKAHGFWSDPDNQNIPTKLMLIVSEIGEAMEEFRDGNVHLIDLEANNKPIGFTSELADAVIRIMDLAEWLGLPLETMMEEKHEYNKTRPYKHGKKV